MTTPVALVGYGTAGAGFHAPLLRAAGLDVVTVVTGNPERAAAARAALPGVRVVPDLASVWSEPHELVVLATPNDAHAAGAREAAEHSVAVVVDKPMARDAAEARAMVSAAEAAGVPLTVFQNRRWDPEHLTLRRLLQDGALGEVLRFESRYERWRPQLGAPRWRESPDPSRGGGLLLDLHSHLVDQAVQLFGRVDTVYAELSSRRGAAEDDTFLALTHAAGVVSHLWAGALAAAPGPRLRLLGSAGAYVVADVEGEPTAFSEFADASTHHRGWLVRGEQREPVDRASGGWPDFYPAVLRALQHGSPMPVDPHDAVGVLEVLDAARMSAAGRTVMKLG